MDMKVNKIPALVKVGRQIISMTLPETVMNSHKKRSTPTSELSEEALMSTMALALRLLIVAAPVIPKPSAPVVLALLYI